ncbi:uncharacterized protein L969DRAFT_95002 [Mixia osmundae IAM 14324]|uniref:Timeless N-terminal domain-containing protein n=1 Tax=Mixia osmundae (strain CBS 9802 / IAM 14324 / JCM 22182 / KY 12970) TaxID=764103 RepID=G7E123_MIXOS|nr:uncharacterized protein L969DRAFT_95002 [Mixia osmundae IAM 14324]KEI38831.1 hypothetical protein L969DRAFT_95002 [Mixia osmundae IAM 14324]GAA96533.1 hypothetical protein E5Q_03201 [Mixia osmundae IAM 14324]
MGRYDVDEIDEEPYESLSEEETLTQYGDDEKDDRQARKDDQVQGEDGEPLTRRELFKPAIVSICSALGGFEEETTESGEYVSVYKLGDECLKCLKDLKRFWRMDDQDDDRTVARLCFETGVLSKDLLPILLSQAGTGPRGDKIALACADLIGAMTWPIDVAEELKEAAEEAAIRGGPDAPRVDFASLLRIQLTYKAAILKANAVETILKLCVPSLAKPRRDRTEKDANIITLVLHIFRNLAAIKDRPRSAATSTQAVQDSTLQSELIQSMNRHEVFQVLLNIAHLSMGNEFRVWNLVVLDIFHLIFRGCKPADLVGDVDKSTSKGLQSLLEAEDSRKRIDQRKGSSRHNRFGTTLTLRTTERSYTLHKQSAVNVSPTKIIDRVKKTKAKPLKIQDELTTPTELTPEALKALQQIAQQFIESCFNNFFESVGGDIRAERPKVREADHLRYLFLSRFFLEYFLLLIASEKAAGIDPSSEQGHDFDLVADMTEIDTVNLVTKRMRIGLDDKPVRHSEVQGAVELFTQILLLLESLSASSNEDHRDVAQVMQDKIYYEEEILATAITVVDRYGKRNTLQYLESVIHFAYTMLRTLERYSKSTAHMYVRSKRKKIAQRKKRAAGEAADDGHDEDSRPDSGARSKSEHAFNFAQFEARFATEATLNTCVAYLRGYKTFRSDEQMKRIVGLMHRQAVKANNAALFWKISTLTLFGEIHSDRQLLPSTRSYNDLYKFVEFVLRGFFKAAQQAPLVIVEALFPHRKSDVKRLQSGFAQEDEDNSDDEVATRALKMPAELVVKRGFTQTQQMGIAISLLADAYKEYLLDWVKDTLRTVLRARKEVVEEIDGPPETQMDLTEDIDDAELKRRHELASKPSEAALAAFQAYDVPYDDADTEKAATKDPQLQLLLRLISWESRIPEHNKFVIWTVPARRLPKEMEADLRMIDDFLINPLDANTGQSAAELVRKQAKKRPKRARVGSDGLELSEEEPVPSRKRTRKQDEQRQAYLSTQFIASSDEEEGLDQYADFFAKEAEAKRKRDAGGIVGGSVQPISQMSQQLKVVKPPAEPMPAPVALTDRSESSQSPVASKHTDPSSSTPPSSLPLSHPSSPEPSAPITVRSKDVRRSSSPAIRKLSKRRKRSVGSSGSDAEDGMPSSARALSLSPQRPAMRRKPQKIVDSDSE